MKYFIFIISFFVVEALQASDERDNHSELLDAKAKLLDIGWAYQHHQSDFRIPEDCVGDDRCNKLLVEQNLNILQVFIMDSLKYLDRKSTRLNSSHVRISYAVFCLKKKIKK